MLDREADTDRRNRGYRAPRWLIRPALGALLLAALAFTGGAGATSDSSVDFEDGAHDGLVITDQFAYQGVTFGLASAHGVSFASDCGGPTQRDDASLAHGGERYAEAGRCNTVGESARSGTFAAFSFPHRVVSAWVGQNVAGNSVRMVAYGADGQELAESTLTTPQQGAKRAIAIVRPGPDIRSVSFELTDPTGSGIHMVLDDLQFDNVAAPINTQGRTIAATAGQPFSGVVGHFSDDDPTAQAADFGASINWGDGTNSTGTVNSTPGSGFDINGSHTWANTGTYTITITLTKPAYGRSQTFTSVANVAQTGGSATGTTPGSGGGGGLGGGGLGGGGGIAPSISVTSGASATLSHSSWISAGASTAHGGAQIATYEWDLNNDGRFNDITCGAGVPAVSHAFAQAGPHTVGVRITDSSGASAEAHIPVNVTHAEINVRHGAQTVATCENPGGNNQPDSADCVKSFAFNLIDVNSRGDQGDCIKLEGTGPTARTSSVGTNSLPGARSDASCYRATIKGPVSLNGVYLPLPSDFKSEYDQCNATVGLPSRDISVGQYKLVHVDLNFSEHESGVNGRHRIGEVPLKGLSDLFGFKIGGKVTLDLTYHATEVKLHVDLPNIFNGGSGEPAQGDVTLHLDNQSNGIRLDHLRIAVPTVFLGALEIDNFFLDYMRDGDVWNGGGDLKFGPNSPFTLRASPPPPDNGFGLKHGSFSHAGAELIFSASSAPEVFPGIFLTHIGFTIGTSPTRFSGNVTLNVGTGVDVEGKLVMVFAGPGEPYLLTADEAGDNLAPLAGRTFKTTALAVGGGVYLTVPRLGRLPAFQGHLLYLYPGYVEFGGGFDFSYSIFSINGGIGGFVDVEKNTFNVEGQVHACVDDVGCLSAAGLISSTGIAACGPVSYGPFTIYIGVGYRWGESFPHPQFFDCDLGPYRVESTVRAADTSRSFTLPAGLPSAMVEVAGTGDAPTVTLTGPNGESASSPASGTAITSTLAVVREPKTDTTYIGIKNPAAGTWTVTPQPASTPISSVSVAQGLPAPSIHARVSGHGATRTLSYDIKPEPGQSVAFAEHGADTYRQLGAAHGAKGSLTFTPTFGSRGKRTIVALVQHDGVLAHALDVASYQAPAPALPSRPRGLRVRRHGAVLVVTFGRSRGALRYAVNLRLADGGRRLVVTRKRTVSVRGIDPRLGGTVAVSGLRLDNRFGPPAKARFARAGRPGRH